MKVSTNIKISFDEKSIQKLVEAAIREKFPNIEIDEFNFQVKRSPQRIEIEVEGTEGDVAPVDKTKAEIVEKKNNKLAAALDVPAAAAEPEVEDDSGADLPEMTEADDEDDSPIDGGNDVEPQKRTKSLMEQANDEVDAEEAEAPVKTKPKKTLGGLFDSKD